MIRSTIWILTVFFAAVAPASAVRAESLSEKLKATSLRIAYECYVDGNWEIFVANADGSGAMNLTNTPKVNEHYPQISPDGARMCYSVDDGEGRSAVRSLWVMDVDGRNRRKIADGAREPFWAPDCKVIGYLPQEFPKFNVIDYFTKGMKFYNLETGKTTDHPNSEKLHHLYNPCFAPNGKWIAATVHSGMGVSHAILLIEANGEKIINLKIPGCRPCISPDGKQIAWGPGDHELAVAPIDLDAAEPSVGARAFKIKDEKNKIYHVDWSPDSHFLSFSRGPDGEGDLTKAGTFQAACEIVGVYAKGWDIYAVAARGEGTLDLNKADPGEVVQVTSNGNSNKEPAWFSAKGSKKE
jgi:Tol biopolymer transport system component